MATNPDDFRALVDPIVKYLDQTTSRVPFVDSYVTTDVHSQGMHARPVIGGVFIRFLTDRDVWKRWAAGDLQTVGDWAPLPRPPTITEVVPTARNQKLDWQYTTAKPTGDDWTKPDFKADGWKTGRAGFGTVGPAGTRWHTDDIWIRRQVKLPDPLDTANLAFVCWHDEDVEVYVDGVPAAAESGFINSYGALPIDPAAKALLKPGATVTIAAHCHQTVGGQYIDIGLGTVTE